VPAAYRVAEVLPFRWWYVWTLFMIGVAPIALWNTSPLAFAAAAVLTLLAIYGFQFRAAGKRLALIKWGQVATVTGTEMLSRGTYYSGTTWSNVYLPVAHGWTVTRQRWSGPSTKTRIRYTLNSYQGQLVVRGREYIDGVVLADQRNPARALCVTSFAYDLDRDESGNWIGKLRPRLQVGMACWLVIVAGWLALAALVATNAVAGGGATTSAPGGKDHRRRQRPDSHDRLQRQLRHRERQLEHDHRHRPLRRRHRVWLRKPCQPRARRHDPRVRRRQCRHLSIGFTPRQQGRFVQHGRSGLTGVTSTPGSSPQTPPAGTSPARWAKSPPDTARQSLRTSPRLSTLLTPIIGSGL
jgi:hypothetical protein